MEGLLTNRKATLSFRDKECDTWSNSGCCGKYSEYQTVRTTAIEYVQVSNDINVLYLPISNENPEAGRNNDIKNTFGIRFDIFAIGAQERKCFVIPVYSDKWMGISKMMGLTGRCVCMECILEKVYEAEKNKIDVTTHVYRTMSTPTVVKMTRRDTPGWSPGCSAH